MNKEETICAIATAPGGAIGLIRVSGPDAIDIVDQIFTTKNNINLNHRKANTITFGYIKSDNETILDEVLVSLFKAPHSYTGEDSIEISCHGSRYIMQQIIQLLIAHGCRTATPGEYTKRAFLNQKMDLCQAEAVADLIAANSAATHQMAMNQIRGGVSHELSVLRDKLLHLTSLLELELDFSDHEELEFADRSELKSLSHHIQSKMKQLADSFSTGNALKNGVPVAIAGETNAGKSTLLNTLLNEDKAIVSDIHGTTRDTIEDTTIIDGITFRFIDTAGIRRTDDVIEAMGIARSYKAIDQARIVILLYDITREEENLRNFYSKIKSHLAHKDVILAMNKQDNADNTTKANIPQFIDQTSANSWNAITISAKMGRNIDSLRSLLINLAGISNITNNDVILTNIRHYEALTQALYSINRVIDGLDLALSVDIIAQDLRECLYHLNDILGEVTTNEVLSNIFKHFCIGK